MDAIRLEVAEYHLAVALVLSLENRESDAIAEYNRAIQINPESAWGYYGRAKCYQALGEFECALEDYTESIRLDPDYPEAFSGRAQVHCKLMQEDIVLTEQVAQRCVNWAMARGDTDPYYRYMDGILTDLYRMELNAIKQARTKYMLSADSAWDDYLGRARCSEEQFRKN